jgi:hypothetical protein
MAYAEQFYLDPHPQLEDPREALLYSDETSILRTEVVESSWQDFLKINEASHFTPARAYSALNTAELIKWELAQEGLDRPEENDTALSPLMLNDTIAYMAQGELLSYYASQNISKGAIMAQKKAYRTLQNNFRDTVQRYASTFGGQQLDRAYQGITEVLDYAAIVVLGPTASRKKKSIAAAKMRVDLPTDAKDAVKMWQRATHLTRIK